MQLPELTTEQIDAILRIGDPDSVAEAIHNDVINELMKIGILYQRSDGHFDFTELGDLAYKTLAPMHGYARRWGE